MPRVWPEMLAELKAAGAANYSIFLHGDGPVRLPRGRGLRPRSARTWPRATVNARWQADMAGLIDPLTDPATGFHRRLEEVFHLD